MRDTLEGWLVTSVGLMRYTIAQIDQNTSGKMSSALGLDVTKQMRRTPLEASPEHRSADSPTSSHVDRDM
ncbi:hypothetical protein GP475_04860 [Corynebacterium poyangense]|uniref:Uncharacterized protein n=1 Tax=Corynebacterium poyangense TaxID=2684405 RepID=A0A7H0SNC2_9CORY|nr:hypothetical protein [Corynebacterium poyangense]MBZ8177073.1 hypothetical protein [Corynebacterium poyangense]QNQ90047.1 hypothetical protein GP475_04860 [Corynebacterium poyangense]